MNAVGYFHSHRERSTLPPAPSMIRRMTSQALRPQSISSGVTARRPSRARSKASSILWANPARCAKPAVAARSFDGVDGPEHPVHQRRIARLRLQRQKGGVEFNQQIQSLRSEMRPAFAP